VLFTGVELTFNRSTGVTVGGAAIGQQIQDGITITPTPTAVEDKPILPTHLDVYVDATSAGLGTTKLTRDFNAVFRCTDRFNPIWPINSTLLSYGSHVEKEPTVQMEITVEADTQGMAFLVNARAGDTRYIRLSAVAPGAVYGFAGAATANYQLLIDMAGKISNVQAFGDEEGVKTLTYTFDAIYDAAWSTGLFCKVQLQNKTAAL
jgi:hypothetical protein